MRSHEDPAAGGAVRLLRGRFEAQFDDVEEGMRGWLSVGRRQLPFPGDERDRYASRFHAIAAQHGGVFSRFVEEPPAREETHGD